MASFVDRQSCCWRFVSIYSLILAGLLYVEFKISKVNQNRELLCLILDYAVSKFVGLNWIWGLMWKSKYV